MPVVALLGFGHVGRELYRLLQADYGDVVDVRRILVRDTTGPGREEVVDKLTTNFEDVLGDPAIEIVVELMGGEQPARDYIERSLRERRHVVTANKAVIAGHGRDLLALATSNGVRLRFEAAVGGGVPLIRIMRQLRYDRLGLIAGILNGTSNFVLTHMERHGVSFDVALSRAKEAGFAEGDPELDLNGTDTTQKLSILTAIGYGANVAPGSIPTQGIRGEDWQVIPADIHYFRNLGYEVRLLGMAKRYGPELEISTGPVLVPRSHALAMVPQEYNALHVEGASFKQQFFFGPGAGPEPTAVAVASGIGEIAQGSSAGWSEGETLADYGVDSHLRLRASDSHVARGFIRSLSPDQLGVFQHKLEILSAEGVNVQGVKNVTEALPGTELMPDYVEIDPVDRSALDRAIARIAELSDVVGTPMFFRVEDDLQSVQ